MKISETCILSKNEFQSPSIVVARNKKRVLIFTVSFIHKIFHKLHLISYKRRAKYFSLLNKKVVISLSSRELEGVAKTK